MIFRVPKGRCTSTEHRFATENECYKAAGQFIIDNSGARVFTLANGFSFQTKQNPDVEERFIYVAAADVLEPSLPYYEAMEGSQPARSLGALRKIYNECINSGNYTGILAPTQNGGEHENGRPTARCILKSKNSAAEDYLCLMVNPPFPHGHGAAKKRRKKRNKKAFSVLAGLAVGFTTLLLRKQLGKLFR
jgi:hypothetical protein